MKKLILFLIMLIGLSDVSAQYNVTVVNSTKDVITVRCLGYGKKASVASKDAELSAIKALLFVGIANSKYNVPLIQDIESDVEFKNQRFFEDFYNEGYRNFIESSVVVTPFGKNSLKQKCITIDVSVRVVQMRAYLEKNGIIRKFGL